MKEVVLFIILCSTCLGAACVNYMDCPEPACPGAIRLCQDNQCGQSRCIVPAAQDLDREGVETFREAVAPYEEGINLSVRTGGPLRNDILGSMGLHGILMLMLKGMGIFVVGLICALLIALARSHGLLRYIVFAGVGGLAVFGALFIMRGQEHGWSSYSAGDLSFGTRTSLSDSQLSLISPAILAAEEYVVADSRSEASVVVLEMQDANYFPSITLSFDGFEDVIGDEEALVYQGRDEERIVMDEDRFVFIISAPPGEGEQVARRVLADYQDAPTPTRLFGSDREPPAIFGFSPAPGEFTSSDVFSFVVSDNGTGVDIGRVGVRSMPAPDCRPADLHVWCQLRGGLRMGENNLVVSAYDKAGNFAQKPVTVFFDNASVALASASPASGYTSSGRVILRFTDSDSGILRMEMDIDHECNATGTQAVCALRGRQGRNQVLIETEDMAHNVDIISYSFIYDPVPPVIRVGQDIEIEEEWGLSGVLVDGGEALHRCSRTGTTYYCPFSGRDVTATDFAGNMAKY